MPSNSLKATCQIASPILLRLKSLFYMDAESMSNVHIPEELCRQILLRLPVKSLLRFCCVSKSWLSMIKDPEFRYLHRQTFKNNRDETHLLVVQGSSRDCVVRRSDNMEINSPTLLTLEATAFNIKCCIHGLVLLESTTRKTIWNPSIRKFHDIPCWPRHLIETQCHDECREVEIGLGYDAVARDYKYVKLCEMYPINHSGDSMTLVAVYTLGAGSWKITPFQAKGGASDFVRRIRRVIDRVNLQGNIYFVYRPNWKVWELGWFDVSSEEFCSTALPKYLAGRLNDPERRADFKLVRDGDSSLALMINDGNGRLTMPVFDIKSKLWTKLCEPGLFVPEFLYLKKNRDILIRWSREEGSFSLANRKSLVRYFSLVSSCNLDTKDEEILLTQKSESSSVPCEVYGYVESLLLL